MPKQMHHVQHACDKRNLAVRQKLLRHKFPCTGPSVSNANITKALCMGIACVVQRRSAHSKSLDHGLCRVVQVFGESFMPLICKCRNQSA